MITTASIGCVRTIAEAPRAAHRADPDDDVLGLIDDGDLEAALRRLMQRHGARVYRYCRAALHDATLAEDVHQQTFIQAFRDLPRFKRRSAVRTWLFAIARNRVRDAARARRRGAERIATAAGALDPEGTSDDSPADWLDDARLQQALIASLDELDEDTRGALLLRHQQGLSFGELGALYGEKPGTIGARVARGLRRLRLRIEARLGGSDHR